jgi:hypothetical protein
MRLLSVGLITLGIYLIAHGENTGTGLLVLAVGLLGLK